MAKDKAVSLDNYSKPDFCALYKDRLDIHRNKQYDVDPMGARLLTGFTLMAAGVVIAPATPVMTLVTSTGIVLEGMSVPALWLSQAGFWGGFLSAPTVVDLARDAHKSIDGLRVNHLMDEQDCEKGFRKLYKKMEGNEAGDNFMRPHIPPTPELSPAP